MIKHYFKFGRFDTKQNGMRGKNTAASRVENLAQGPYSQHFIFFVTYE